MKVYNITDKEFIEYGPKAMGRSKNGSMTLKNMKIT